MAEAGFADDKAKMSTRQKRRRALAALFVSREKGRRNKGVRWKRESKSVTTAAVLRRHLLYLYLDLGELYIEKGRRSTCYLQHETAHSCYIVAGAFDLATPLALMCAWSFHFIYELQLYEKTPEFTLQTLDANALHAVEIERA